MNKTIMYITSDRQLLFVIIFIYQKMHFFFWQLKHVHKLLLSSHHAKTDKHNIKFLILGIYLDRAKEIYNMHKDRTQELVRIMCTYACVSSCSCQLPDKMCGMTHIFIPYIIITVPTFAKNMVFIVNRSNLFLK